MVLRVRVKGQLSLDYNALTLRRETSIISRVSPDVILVRCSRQSNCQQPRIEDTRCSIKAKNKQLCPPSSTTSSNLLRVFSIQTDRWLSHIQAV